MKKMTNLQDMRAGDWVRWGSIDWEVIDRTLYRESADYQEVQWELEGSGDTRYLVMSTENKGGTPEVVWVCTRQTGINRIQRPREGGGWVNFREKDSMSAAPPKVKFDGVDYSLEGETEGTAESDEGETVTKLTWDYYDASRKRNLAIEVWQCSDADYYEAYDGQVVRSADFVRIPPRARKGLPKGEALGSLVIAGFSCLFFLPIVGGMMGAFDTGAEYLVALMLPALLAFTAFLAGTHRGMLAAGLGLGIAAGIAMLKTLGLGLSYWQYAGYGLAVGAAAAELGSRLLGGARRSDKPWTAGLAALLALFILSFAHYIQFAPRPHNPGGLLAACALPLLPAALIFAGYFFLGGSDEQA